MDALLVLASGSDHACRYVATRVQKYRDSVSTCQSPATREVKIPDEFHHNSGQSYTARKAGLHRHTKTRWCRRQWLALGQLKPATLARLVEIFLGKTSVVGSPCPTVTGSPEASSMCSLPLAITVDAEGHLGRTWRVRIFRSHHHYSLDRGRVQVALFNSDASVADRASLISRV